MYPQPKYHLVKNPEGFLTAPLEKKKFIGGAKILCKCGHKNALHYTACRKCGLPLNNKKQTYFIKKKKEIDNMNFSNDNTFPAITEIKENMTELKKYNENEKYKIRWVCSCNVFNDLSNSNCCQCTGKILPPSEQKFRVIWTEVGLHKWDIFNNEKETIDHIKMLESSSFKCCECGFHNAIYNKTCISCKKSLARHPYFIEDEKVKEKCNPQPFPIQEKEEYEWPDLPITKNEELESMEKIHWKNKDYMSVQNRLYRDQNINISFTCPECKNVSKFGLLCQYCDYRAKQNQIFDIRENNEVIVSNTIGKVREYLKYNPMKRRKLKTKKETVIQKTIPVEKFITITTGTTTKKFSVVGKKISHILEMFRESGMESDFLLNDEKVDSSTILKHEDNLKLIPKEIEKNSGVLMKILKGLETTIIPQEEITDTFIEVEQILTYTNEDILNTLIQNKKLKIYKTNWSRSPKFINTDEIVTGLHDIREEERKKEEEQKTPNSDIEKRLLSMESKLNKIEKETTYIKLGVISTLKFLQKLDEKI